MVTDDILYRRYLSGDEDGLSALMERHGDKLTLYLDDCLHDLHESEDLMIEVFAYLIAKQPRIRDGGFRAYLYRSARHMALRLLSRKRAQLCFSLDALTEEPEARAEREASAVPEEREPLAPRIARFQPLCLIPCLYQAKSQSRRHWLRSANVQPNRHAPVRQDPQVSVPCPRSA